MKCRTLKICVATTGVPLGILQQLVWFGFNLVNFGEVLSAFCFIHFFYNQQLFKKETKHTKDCTARRKQCSKKKLSALHLSTDK
jgi:hypothetical protein